MQLLDFCMKYHRIALYGAGVYGRRLYHVLEDAGVSVHCWVVTKKGSVHKFLGMPIYSWEEWKENPDFYGTGILIATSDLYVNEIQNHLNLNHCEDYFYAGEWEIAIFRRITKPVQPINFLTIPEPVSRFFGYDRGTPIDRYYIEKFLSNEISALGKCSRILEVGETVYSDKYFPLATRDILDFANGMDLTKLKTLPIDMYDVFICTQVFNFIYDVRMAVKGAFSLLRMGGVMLATVAGNISPISRSDMEAYGHFWGFTYLGIKKIISDVFGENNVRVFPFGNSVVATAFLQGMSVEDLPPKTLLDVVDADYSINIGIVATKRRSDCVGDVR